MSKPLNNNIPVVILAGGQGSRIRDVTTMVPKPMIDIGGLPIIWHIMNHYAFYGFKRFIICLGYMGDKIKQFFLNYRAMMSDFTICLGSSDSIRYKNMKEEINWEITCVDTGLNTMTGGRVWRVRDYIDTEQFMLVYGDGVSDINIHKLLQFHLSHDKIGTVTGVHPPGRFGDLMLSGNKVVDFSEKRQVTQGVINGGFFIFRREFICKYLEDRENLILERDPLESLARDGELMCYLHEGFWHCMDTARDYNFLNELWRTGQAKWQMPKKTCF